MKGEEFFGEVKEERLIDRDLSWFLFFVVVFLFSFSVFGYFRLSETGWIESYWTWSYWLEVMGFALIIGDLFFEERTKKLLSLGEGHFTPGDANFLGWWKVMALVLFSILVGFSLGSILEPFGDDFGTQEAVFFLSIGSAIFYGPYFYVLDKMNDRLLASGVGLATTGLTLATSAQITTTFFSH
jgi:hypothetical protein